MNVHHCTGCGQRVLRARTEARRWQLLNPDPNPAGKVAAHRDGTGTWRARTLREGQEPAGLEQRFMPHPATCAKPPPRRRQRRGEARHAAGQPARRPAPAPVLFGGEG